MFSPQPPTDGYPGVVRISTAHPPPAAIIRLLSSVLNSCLCVVFRLRCRVIELKQTVTFRQWYAKLRDERAATAIASRLDRLAFGHVGDAKPVGEGVSELRIHYGPGYRVYFQRRGETIIVLLCGGDKNTQARDIQAALRLADERSE